MSHIGQVLRTVTIMKITDLLIRPRQHISESDVAYVFRLAELNASDFKFLAKNLLVWVSDRRGYSYRLVSDKYNISDFFSLDRIGKQFPVRKICSKCIAQGLPDFYFEAPYFKMDYCLLHKSKLFSKCPKCRVKIRYSRGSYSLCKCGFQWRDFKDDEEEYIHFDLFEKSIRSVTRSTCVLESDLTPKLLKAVADKYYKYTRDPRIYYINRKFSK